MTIAANLRAKCNTVVGLLVLCIALSSSAQLQSDTYLSSVKPLLKARCFACHGALKQQSGLRLDTFTSLLKGGKHGPAIIPGNPDISPLVLRVTTSQVADRMPPEHEGEPLKTNEIALLKAWILDHPKAPSQESPEPDPGQHWAFKPLARSIVPHASNPGWLRNPVDAFIASRHQSQGVMPQSEAPRPILIRRLYLDLIGVPPTLDELDSWLYNKSSHWYENLVSQLLNDPRHGQRWARHFMDIWRYSDWWGLGDQLRNSQKHIWHWRDWIVESLNSDLAYDAMIRLMLAADESHPDDLQALRATGFLARNWFLFNRNQWMEEIVEHVGKGFLGLTLNCAKCHDHKYDPISQSDYYRMRAFFEPYHVRQDVVPGEPDPTINAIPRAFDAILDANTYLFVRGNESTPDKSKPMLPGIPSVLDQVPFSVTPVSLPITAYQPERRPWVFKAHIDRLTTNLNLARTNRNQVQSSLIKMLQYETKLLASTHHTNYDAITPPVPAPHISAEAAAGEESIKWRADFEMAKARAEIAALELSSFESRAKAQSVSWNSTTTNPPNSKNHNSTVNPDDLRIQAIKAERHARYAQAKLTFLSAKQSHDKATIGGRAEVEKALKSAKDALETSEKLLTSEIKAADSFTRIEGAQWIPTRFLNSGADDPKVPFPSTSTGRRLALANWIASEQNPLTARVLVNHVWTRHLGSPLVSTPFDFGRKGASPTHPELLDWLASEFIKQGWSLKHLHRLIVTSSTYRMDSTQRNAASNLAKDPDNLSLWRREPIRIEAEILRDSLLALPGTLNSSHGGPSVEASKQDSSARRSLYFFHSNNDRNLFLTTFDGPSVKECYRREQSIVPQQALAMSHSKLVTEAARKIANNIRSQATRSILNQPDQDAWVVKHLFLLILGYPPSSDEFKACMNAYQKWETEADLELAMTLLNHNDFVTLR